MSKVSEGLQSAYDEQYTDEMTEWRELGGKFKAANIVRVCRGHNFSKVIECGAGEGSILKCLEDVGAFPELYAAEISDSGIRQIQARQLRTLKEVRKFDGYRLPYADQTFDMAYCSHVLEHVEHPRLLLRELMRVSRYQVFEIPLDYSPRVDERVDDFLAYGHINIYTPSLFRFLLKSEGYEILNEVSRHEEPEVVRYNWYRNQQLEKTLRRELQLRLSAAIRFLRKLKSGQDHYRENGYSTYTCLAQAKGSLKVF